MDEINAPKNLFSVKEAINVPSMQSHGSMNIKCPVIILRTVIYNKRIYVY